MSFLNYMMKGLVKNMSNIWTIVKKELKRFFTDPRMIIGLVLPGVLIFVIYNLMGNISMEKIAPTITDFTVYVENEPTEFQSFLNKDGWNINKNKENLSKDKIIDKIKDKKADLYIIYEEDFYQKMLAYDIDTGKMAPNIEIYYNSTSESSNLFYSYYLEILNQYESNISNKFDINRDLDIKYDVAKKEDTTIQIISMMLPFLLMVFLFSGAMGVCSESVAGEKERGTIATLLITPTKKKSYCYWKNIVTWNYFFSFSACKFFRFNAIIAKINGNRFFISSIWFINDSFDVSFDCYDSIIIYNASYNCFNFCKKCQRSNILCNTSDDDSVASWYY